MKLFQQLLVAPAALGLLAPLAANAAEVNINDVANYATPDVAVSTAQFSDVVPGDWAYTALQNLSESYGCVDNAYTQNLKSGQALTRYEAAALVNACLEGGIASADVNSDAVRLSNEFGTEMAILKGRVDGLEYKVEELSAGQFSSMTKMTGGAVFTTGAIDSPDSTTDNKLLTEWNFTVDLNTSFNGSDLLYAGFEAGNQGDLAMDSAVRITENDGTEQAYLSLASLYYSFPVGDFQITAGPLFDEDDVISATTSVYSDAFRLAGNRFTTGGTTTGTGGAVEWANGSGFNASLAFVTPNASAASGTVGILTTEGQDVAIASAGYDADNWGIGAVYRNSDNMTGSAGSKDLGFGAYYRPDSNLPSVSVMWDTRENEEGGTGAAGANPDQNAFMVAIDYEVGPGTFSAAWESVESVHNDLGDTNNQTQDNYEIYYNYPVADGINIQGGIFVEPQADGQDDTTGYVVETFFMF